MKFSDKTLIRTGYAVMALGLFISVIKAHIAFVIVGFIIMGIGSAPIYPCIIHMTPRVFGEDRSQAMIGIQMAFAYTGFCIVPPLFGVIAQYVSIALLPPYLLVFLVVMAIMHETMILKTRK